MRIYPRNVLLGLFGKWKKNKNSYYFLVEVYKTCGHGADLFKEFLIKCGLLLHVVILLNNVPLTRMYVSFANDGEVKYLICLYAKISRFRYRCWPFWKALGTSTPFRFFFYYYIKSYHIWMWLEKSFVAFKLNLVVKIYIFLF